MSAALPLYARACLAAALAPSRCLIAAASLGVFAFACATADLPHSNTGEGQSGLGPCFEAKLALGGRGGAALLGRRLPVRLDLLAAGLLRRLSLARHLRHL